MGAIGCLLLLGIGVMGFAAADRCRELAELNAKYTTLRRQFEADWKKQGRYSEDLLQAVRSVNTQQRRIIFSLLREAESGQDQVRQDCCRSQSKDLILKWVCVMSAYLRDRDAVSLVKAMPADLKGITSLWQMDEILGDVPPSDPAEAPEVLRDKSFAGHIISRVDELVQLGDDLALSRFLSLLLRADGHYAEDLEERFARLLIQYPRVVLSRWSTVKKFAPRLHVGTTGFASQLDEVLKIYRSECKTLKISAGDCQEILRFLKRLGTS